MSHHGKQHGGGGEEGGGHSVGLWYVSFSDMITLLLSFFVMLATFSSYSKEGINRFAGACAYIAAYSFIGVGRPDRGVLPTERFYEKAKEGSEKPTDLASREPAPPRPSRWMPDTDAYQKRRELRLASREMFFGRGTALTPLGVQKLELVADFLKRMPCRLTVRETGVEGDAARERVSLGRCWSVVNYLTTHGGVPAETVSIARSRPVAGRATGEDAAAMEFVLLAPEATP